VNFHRVFADAQGIGDITVAETFVQHHQQLFLALRQLFRDRWAFFAFFRTGLHELLEYPPDVRCAKRFLNVGVSAGFEGEVGVVGCR
jgi:hypothetical protein